MDLYRYRSNFEFAQSEILERKVYAARRDSLNDHTEAARTRTIVHADGWRQRKTIPIEGGVVSYMTSPDDPLMWGLYGGSHRGFCIRYDQTECPVASTAEPVDYADLGNTVVMSPELYLRHKNPEWAHEQEWRVVTDKPGYHPVQTKPTGIIAGLRTSDFFRVALQRVAMELQTADFGWVEARDGDRLEVMWMKL